MEVGGLVSLYNLDNDKSEILIVDLNYIHDLKSLTKKKTRSGNE